MPSRAEARQTVEGVLRAVSIGTLAWMLWTSLDHDSTVTVARANSASIGSALRDWTLEGTAPARISVSLDSAPLPVVRDWLAALGAAGSKLSWSGDVPAVGIGVRPIPSPAGGLTVLVAAPSGTLATLHDEVGPLDTVEARNGGARFTIPVVSGAITARVEGTVGESVARDSVRLRRVLVIGRAGWESKFVIAALEESGWMVDAQIAVAPGAFVTQGGAASLDTARYSAILALDETAVAHAQRIAAYVASGGGLVLAGSAASLQAFASLRAATPGRTMTVPEQTAEPQPTTLQTLPLAVLASGSDAVILDRRGSRVAVVARRHGSGRVLQYGYIDSWRWRMSGGETSVVEHRAWWTGAVSSVAYVPTFALAERSDLDNAPLAHLVEALGERSATPSASLASAAGSISLWWLFVLVSLSLLAEWASRRLRGAR